MFKPEYAILAAIGICLALGIGLMSYQGVKSAAPAAQAAEAAPAQATASTSGQAQLSKATLDLAALAKANTIDEVDNLRWALVRDSQAGQNLYTDAAGVSWKELRQLTQAGTIRLPAGGNWSFNQAYQEGVGYKNASGVLAGGQCALATVLRVAASRAGLVTEARQHRYPVPGFTLAETVNIWWGRDDLVVRNPTRQDLALAWILTPQTLTVTVIPAPAAH